MVAIARRKRSYAGWSIHHRHRFKIVMLVLLANLGCMALWRSWQLPKDAADWSLLEGSVELNAVSLVSKESQSRDEGASFKELRKRLSEECESAQSREEVLKVGERTKDMFVMPTTRVEQPRDEKAIIPCKLVVMDFGANVGDTSGHTIDAGLVGCKRNDLHVEFADPHLNLDTKVLEDPKKKKRNPLTRGLVNLMKDIGSSVGPEDYCYYGIEGNPVFTKRLQELEDFIMGMKPRPLKHLHFLTETVGAGKDGPTQLWLDTINKKQNYWGSSIMKGHQDVRKSAREQNTTEVAADVMGLTISTLMKKTMVAFDQRASEQDKKGGHLLLKVDIEGGEYELLIEAANDGTLCKYVNMGNQADLFIEFHSQRVTGANPLVGKSREAKKVLEDCGVKFRTLRAWWS